MIWKDIMLTSYEQPLFNWKQTLSGIDVEKFKRQYLDPASGYVGVARIERNVLLMNVAV